jgi:hypothetical protein
LKIEDLSILKLNFLIGLHTLTLHSLCFDTFLIGLPLHHTGLLLPLHSLCFDTFLIGLPLHHTGLLLPLHSLCFDIFSDWAAASPHRVAAASGATHFALTLF